MRYLINASVVLGFTLAGALLPAQAQGTAPGGMSMSPNMPMPGMHAAADTDETRAFHKSNDDMMRGMDVPLTGQADQDFVASMVPHHQGAVDMAQIELKYGKDPELRALAQAIIKAQQVEIAQMKHWQATHPATH